MFLAAHRLQIGRCLPHRIFWELQVLHDSRIFRRTSSVCRSHRVLMVRRRKHNVDIKELMAKQ